MKFKRVFLIVMDSLGVGAAPDANLYFNEGQSDIGANTFGHIAEKMDLTIPNLEKLGIGNIVSLKGINSVDLNQTYVTKISEASLGKDTMTGHWEMMGMYITKPFQTFTDHGFPQELIRELEEKTGRKVVGNKAASGTEILVELGEHHMKTGDLIVYTSADSVLQIAMHEQIIPIEEQYRISEIAREITMRPEWKVGRVITRPFLGSNKDTFKRTSNRHDYALKPHEKTTLNYLDESGFDVIALGKINDIFDGYGINKFSKTVSNYDGMNQIIQTAKTDFTGLCFLNLVDFDALYGHRRDPIGYGKAIEEFDSQLPELLENLNPDDLLILTADHGNDPTYVGTDHTREFVPMIAYSKSFKSSGELPILNTFSDIGYTINENFGTHKPNYGKSFLNKIK
ncbi:phosphopentomutase [Acholeplasma granularum]|uniref:phosphopentomutase n=1 Tax=Acholeplasma granularum TaxID=264635 RepID=UPI00046F108D|nr:phosphopentomutase [Acholeplasma granularum]